MKKNIYLLFVIALLMMFSCSDSKKNEALNAKLMELKSLYGNDGSIENTVKLAEFYSMQYINGKEKIEEGFEFIKNARTAYPDNSKLQVLQGLLYSRYGGIFAKKMDYSKAMEYMDTGFGIMDEAVEKYPDDAYVLLYRAGCYVSVPKMFNKLEYALSDLDKLYNMKNIDGYRMQILYYYSKALKMNKQNEKYKEIMKELKTKYPDYKKKIK